MTRDDIIEDKTAWRYIYAIDFFFFRETQQRYLNSSW